MKNLNIGLIGFGTIGTGVVKLLQKNKREIANKTGINIHLKKIADIDLKRNRGVKVEPSILTTNAYDIINDKEIDIVIELIGGLDKACEFIINSIKNGKHVVTANKALLSQKGEKIFSLAQKYNKLIGFEASVGGGIPIIKVIRESLIGNKIKKIMGIVNGTTNFILSNMEDKNLNFNEALKLTQKNGFAEAD
ncbi:MAG: homoserine dehydrogenase, partial [Promethearchaeota archaeon]